MKKLWWLLLLSSAALAQVSNPGVRYVGSAPSGACAQAPPVQVLNSSGAIYTCDNGTWAVQGGGGGSGTVTSIATSSPITGGTITTTGTIACATCATGPGSSTSSDFAAYNDTGGLALKDSGVSSTSPTFTGPVTAPGFFPTTITSGPYENFFADFVGDQGSCWAATNIGSPTGASFAANSTLSGTSDIQHPGQIRGVSGTASGNTGVAYECSGSNSNLQSSLNSSSVGWVYQTSIFINTLPLTTANSVQAGLVNAATASPWTTGIAFYLSSANSGFVSANNWGCEFSSTITDSGTLATVGWHTLTMVNNLTDVLWYVDGVHQAACDVAVASISSALMGLGYTITAGTATSISMWVDYVNFQRKVSR